MNLKKILLANGIFLMAIFIILISQYFIPELTGFLSTTNAKMVELMVLLIWILGAIVVPAGFFVWGLTEQSELESQIFLAMTGILYGFFYLLFLYFGWFMINAVSPFMTSGLEKGIYWIGIFELIIFNVIAVPIFAVIEARKQ